MDTCSPIPLNRSVSCKTVDGSYICWKKNKYIRRRGEEILFKFTSNAKCCIFETGSKQRNMKCNLQGDSCQRNPFALFFSSRCTLCISHETFIAGRNVRMWKKIEILAKEEGRQFVCRWPCQCYVAKSIARYKWYAG